MYSYDTDFYEYINRGAIASANVIVPRLIHLLNISSVADFGCGQGAWLTVWKNQGVEDIVGIDGGYIPRESLLIDQNEFVEKDLKEPVRLGRKFDLVQSLEVAEHLPEDRARQFVESLVSHGNMVLFSAAVPGQGGENHVNEQPYEYWRGLFKNHGYLPVDCVRPSICPDDAVEPWYRYNSLVYIGYDTLEGLGSEIQSYAVSSSVPIPDISPLVYRVRKGIIRNLPHVLVTRLAVVKKHLVNLIRGKARASHVGGNH